MDLSFSQEQDMLRDSVSRYLEKSYDIEARKALVASDEPWSADVWTQFAELGLLALPFSEERGGLGGSISDCVAFAQSLGEHLVVEPYVSSVMLAGRAIAASGSAEADALIERIAAGQLIAAFAYEEGAGTSSPALIRTVAERDGDGFRLTGEKRLVIAGEEAEFFVVAARIGENGPVGLFRVDRQAAGVKTIPYVTIDGRSAANVSFANVQLQGAAVLIEDAGDALATLIADAIIVMSAEALGAMGALVGITSEYAMTRKQFGQPIAGFQAIAHRLADMKIAHSKALATLLYTTALANSGAVSERDIAVLKGQLGKLGREIGESAIQIHGGVGLTDELSVSHYHKRLIAYDMQLGDFGYHLRSIGAS